MQTDPPSRRARRAAALAFPLGLVSGLLILVAFGDEPFARFHAWQSILLTVVVVPMIVALRQVPLVGDALGLAVGAAAVVVLLWLAARAWRGRWTLIPLAGDVAAERVR